MLRAFTMALCLGLSSLQGGSQTPPAVSSSNQSPAVKPGSVSYGPPEVTDLNSIVVASAYQRKQVITECEPSIFKPPQFWTCGTDGANVLLIPGKDFDPSEFEKAIQKPMEVRGIVRALREKSYVGQPPVDRDLVEDPLLPPMPPLQQGWPRISITVIAMWERPVRKADDEEEYGAGISLRILEEPAAYLGKTTKIIGQFRGRNLFADLPANSARGKEDWVLRESDGGALWVVGKPPQGQGWKLDLNYKGDSKTWLEVEGKAEVVKGVVYLKASRITPKKSPGVR